MALKMEENEQEDNKLRYLNYTLLWVLKSQE